VFSLFARTNRDIAVVGRKICRKTICKEGLCFTQGKKRSLDSNTIPTHLRRLGGDARFCMGNMAATCDTKRLKLLSEF